MGPAFYVLAILGCGDSETACQQVRVSEAQFASADACAAASSQLLLDSSDLAFPVIMGECRPASRASAQKDGSPRG
jgi:hypothetical protein